MAIPADVYRLQVIIGNVDSVNRDSVVNTFHLKSPSSIGPALGGPLDTAFTAFYQTLWPYMSPACDKTNIRTKYTHLADTPPIYPTYEGTLGVTATPGTTAAPAELAIVLSCHGAFTSGVKRSRVRGRVYLGPWSTSNTGGDRPSHSLATAIISAAQTLQTAVKAVATGMDMVVYSAGKGSRKKDGTYRPDWTPFYTPITTWTVDNAWDVQRRRGLAPNVRWTS